MIYLFSLVHAGSLLLFRLFSNCDESGEGATLVLEHGLLIMVASLVAEHRL